MKSGTAPCGLRYAVKRSGSAVAYCSLSVHCGTRDEEDYHPGIAHFLEHTIFKGTGHRTAAMINSCLDKLGGELNAYTTKEEIVLHATVLREDLSKAAALLLDLATSSTFPAKEVETEKSVVIDEINQYKDSPADDIYDKFEEALFAGHSLGRAILGTAPSVRKIKSEELLDFRKKRFHPGAMAFTVVADIDEERMEHDVLRLAQKYFGQQQDTQAAYRRMLSKPEPVLFDKSIDKRNHEANAIIGSTAPSLYEERERLTAVLLSNILGGPASNSILNSELRERNGWVYGVECSYTQYSDSGIMTIALGCDKENLEKCFKAIDKALLKIRTSPLGETRLKAAKKQLLGQLAISSDNGETQCLSMGKSMLSFGRVASDEENRKAIESITAQEIMDMACRIFEPSRLSRLVYL